MRNLRTTLVILLCFFLTSDGYLAWLDRLLNYVSPVTADILTMDVAYPLQALGILIICLLLRRFKNLAKREFIAGAVIVFAVSVIPAVLANNMWVVIISGLIMNLVCGIVAGYYLYMLVADTTGHRRGLLFALGYAGAAVLSWLFTYILGDCAYNADVTLITCLIVTILACIVIFIPVKQSPESVQAPAMPASTKLIGLAIAVLVLINLVQSIAFTFPSEDIGNGISLELTRLMYAAGLIVAGVVTDKNRKFGSFITLVALIIPFVILALQGMNVSSVALWCIAYLVTGFFSVYRHLQGDITPFSRRLRTHGRPYGRGDRFSRKPHAFRPVDSADHNHCGFVHRYDRSIRASLPDDLHSRKEFSKRRGEEALSVRQDVRPVLT